MLKQFVRDTLQRAGVENKVFSLFLTEENLAIFQEAFTHSSFDKKKNYEKLEHTGDTFVNLCTALYITKRFPEINNEAWLSRIKFFLQGKQTLSKLSYENGFTDNIRMVNVEFTDEYYKDEDLMSILEDVFEAFFGAVGTVADSTISTGAGLEICYKLLSYYFDTVRISITVDFLFDPVTLFKEIGDAEKWNLKSPVTSFKMADGRFRAIVSAPLGVDGSSVMLGKMDSTNITHAKNTAARKALKALDRVYGIRSKRHDDTPTVIRPKHSFEKVQHDRFKKFMNWLLSNKGIPRKYKTYLMSKDVLENMVINVKFCSSFVCMVGPLVLDHAITNFADTVIGEAGEGLKTAFRHEYTKGTDIINYVNEGGFIKVAEDISPYEDQDISDKSMKLMFKGILGGIFMELWTQFSIEIAYRVAYRVCIYMFTTNKSLQPKRDSKSRLYCIFNNMKWPITQGDLIKVDYTDKIYTVTVEGYPEGTRTPAKKNRVLLAESSGKVKADVEEEAYSKAIEKLATRYKIYSRKLFYSS
jgi:dsRNA-specific ribonuclease